MADFEKLAVIIGIDQYSQGIPGLNTPVADAEELAKVLKHEHGYNRVIRVPEKKATLHNLKSLLENLSKVVKENTCLLFYFAGHGIALNGDEGPEGYLIPQDAKLGDTSTYLSMPIVEKALTALPCRHCLIILDCCFAGAFRWSSTRHIAATPKIVYRERYERFTADPAWQVIASSAHDQKALDALAITKERDFESITDEIDGRRHSPFAKALLDALRGEADTYPPAKDGKAPGDGIITATELYLYLRDRVENLTLKLNRRQTPGLWSLKKHDKGEYIFLTKAFDPKSLADAPSLDEKRENNPYRGLEPYEREHSNLFFGRTKLIEKLCNVVCDRPITVVLGASGAGKSSLVKAGLVAHLEQSDEQGTAFP